MAVAVRAQLTRARPETRVVPELDYVTTSMPMPIIAVRADTFVLVRPTVIQFAQADPARSVASTPIMTAEMVAALLSPARKRAIRCLTNEHIKEKLPMRVLTIAVGIYVASPVLAQSIERDSALSEAPAVAAQRDRPRQRTHDGDERRERRQQHPQDKRTSRAESCACPSSSVSRYATGSRRYGSRPRVYDFFRFVYEVLAPRADRGDGRSALSRRDGNLGAAEG